MMAVCCVIIWVLIVVGGCRGEKRWDIVVHILLGCRASTIDLFVFVAMDTY